MTLSDLNTTIENNTYKDMDQDRNRIRVHDRNFKIRLAVGYNGYELERCIELVPVDIGIDTVEQFKSALELLQEGYADDITLLPIKIVIYDDIEQSIITPTSIEARKIYSTVSTISGRATISDVIINILR